MNATTDTYTAEFPHGTHAGFGRGCRGKVGCPNNGTDQLTCMEAHGLYQGNYPFRRAVDQGFILTARSWESDLAALRASKETTPAISIPPASAPAKPRKPRTKLSDDERRARDAARRQEARTNGTTNREEIRAWARANGLEVGNRGKLPKRIEDAYAAAHATPPTDEGQGAEITLQIVDEAVDIPEAPVPEQRDLHQLLDDAHASAAAEADAAVAEAEARARTAEDLVEQLRLQLAEASARADHAVERQLDAHLDRARAEVRAADLRAEISELRAEWAGGWSRTSVEVVATRLTAMLATIDQLEAKVTDFDRLTAQVAHLERELAAAGDHIDQLLSNTSVAQIPRVRA